MRQLDWENDNNDNNNNIFLPEYDLLMLKVKVHL